ncbi:MAG: Nramp family divalent metal transporter [Bacteroidota bacterium]
MWQKLKQIGPGAMVAAAFIGPGTVTTATMAGAGFGYTLLWAILFSVLTTLLLQEMAARLGVISGLGVGEALRKKLTGPVLSLGITLLVLGAILVGNAAYEAGNITGAVLGFQGLKESSGWPFNPLILVIGILAFLLLFSGKYNLIEKSLVGLVSIMGLVFLISAIMLKPDIGSILEGLLIPQLPENSLLLVIGLIGTTVVPYNLFLHASTVKEKWKGAENLPQTRLDTVLSVGLGGLITMAILLCAAVAFEGESKEIEGAADLAIQLGPVLGKSAEWFITLGFLAAGLSSAITAPLAAAYATSEMLDWQGGLKSWKFRAVWGSVLLIGMVFAAIGSKPTSIILLAQVANGLLLPILASFLLWIMNDREIMGSYINRTWTNVWGLFVILLCLGLGIKGILSATNFI